MRLILDALWRAGIYCLHPRVIALSIMPIVIAGASAAALGYYFWEDAVSGVLAWLDRWELAAPALEWINRVSGGLFRSVVGPLVVTMLTVPALLIVSLLLVAFMMGPALIDLVAQRRFAQLQRRRGAAWWQVVLRALAVTLLALVLLVVSLPLWLIPPLALILPPILWGWLTYRILGFDCLAEHADPEERRTVLREHRWPLFGMGVVAGYLGAAPSMVWIAFGVLTLPWAPLAVPLFVWVYTLVFAFTLLWFAHYVLAALQDLRARPRPAEAAPAVAIDLARAAAPRTAGGASKQGIEQRIEPGGLLPEPPPTAPSPGPAAGHTPAPPAL